MQKNKYIFEDSDSAKSFGLELANCLCSLQAGKVKIHSSAFFPKEYNIKNAWYSINTEKWKSLEFLSSSDKFTISLLDERLEISINSNTESFIYLQPYQPGYNKIIGTIPLDTSYKGIEHFFQSIADVISGKEKLFKPNENDKFNKVLIQKAVETAFINISKTDLLIDKEINMGFNSLLINSDLDLSKYRFIKKASKDAVSVLSFKSGKFTLSLSKSLELDQVKDVVYHNICHVKFGHIIPYDYYSIADTLASIYEGGDNRYDKEVYEHTDSFHYSYESETIVENLIPETIGPDITVEEDTCTKIQITEDQLIDLENFKDIDQLSKKQFYYFISKILSSAGWSNLQLLTYEDETFIQGVRTDRNFLIIPVKAKDNYTISSRTLRKLEKRAQSRKINNRVIISNSYITSELKLKALRMGIEVFDRERLQTLWYEKATELGRRITPRKYQQSVIDQSLELFELDHNKILIEMATGLGKTYTAACLIRDLMKLKHHRYRVLFLIHQVEILLQSLTSFRNIFGFSSTFSACFDGSEIEYTDFVFATYDTLEGKLNRVDPDQFDIVIVDEAHHAAARTYNQVITHFNCQYLIGLTATPFRSDEKDIFEIFGGELGHVGKLDIAWALRHNKLAFPKYSVLLDDLDQDKIDQLQMGLRIADLDKNLFLDKKDKEVVRIILDNIEEKKIKDPKAIVFCKNIKSMENLIQYFDEGTATLVHSNMLAEERRKNIREFREGSYNFILVCDLFNEGIDIPETNLLIFLRDTKSLLIWLQQLGRGLRKTKNKETVEVLDFAGSLDRLKDVEYLRQAVESTPVDTSVLEEDETIEDIYDKTIEVSYNKRIEKILYLLDSLKSRLSTGPYITSVLRKYYQENGNLPSIESLKGLDPQITYPILKSLYKSYYGYICEALGNVSVNHQIDKVLDFLQDYYKKHNIVPTLRNIVHQFTYKGYPLFTEGQIKELIGTENELISYVEELLEEEDLQNTQNGTKDVINPRRAELVNKYKDTIKSIDDYLDLNHEHKKDVHTNFVSEFQFLKDLGVIK